MVVQGLQNKCTKKVYYTTSTKLFLCLSNYCFFDVFVAVTVVVANLGYTAVK